MVVNQDKQTSYITLSFESLSPVLAQQWVVLLVHDINATLREKEIHQTQKNIDYLTEQATKTSVVDFQTVFYSLIQEQLKNIMFAQGREDYAFEYIDLPVVPEVKSGPNKKSMVILGCVMGFMLSLVLIFVRAKLKN